MSTLQEILQSKYADKTYLNVTHWTREDFWKHLNQIREEQHAIEARNKRQDPASEHQD